MKWEVTGADRETGIGRSIVVSAVDEESATRKGNQLGILVEKSRLIASTDAHEAAKRHPDAGIPAMGRVSSFLAMALRAMSIGEAIEPPPVGGIPDYSYIVEGNRLLKFFAMLMRAIGIVLLIGAALCLIFALSHLPSSSIAHHEDFSDAMAGVAVALTSAVPCFVGAVLLRMIGTAALALRDMARNSFGKD